MSKNKTMNDEAQNPEEQNKAAEASTEQNDENQDDMQVVLPTPEEYSKLMADLEEVKASLEEEKNKYLRLLAEYDNFRKRSKKEKDSLYSDAKSETISKILPVFDNLEMALKQTTTDEAYAKGVEMTMQELVGILEKLGAKPAGEAGESFNPDIHNAVMHIEDDELGENVIAEVFQKGFLLGDKVIRCAMVKVAN